MAITALSQPDSCQLEVKGLVLKKKGDKHLNLKDVPIKINEEGKGSRIIRSDTMWRFNFSLDLDSKYEIVFGDTNLGYVQKIVFFDTYGVPHDSRSGGDFNYVFDIDLFENIPYGDTQTLKKPVAYIVYDKENDHFSHTKDYTKREK